MTSLPPVFVPLKGGLGNQMFEIAGGYAYARREGGQLELLRLDRCGDRPVSWDTFFVSLMPYLVTSPRHVMPIWYEPTATKYVTPPSLTQEGQCLDGYMQSSKYFADAAEEIRTLFRPPRQLEVAVEEKYAYFLSQTSRVVVMHARRTDYLLNQAVHAPLLGDYYAKAIKYVFAKVDKPLFMLVSDDPSFWGSIEPQISEVFQGEFHILKGVSEVETMILLQRFKYFVMSNSTFIWWAAWLANPTKEDGQVWAPSRWFGPKGPSEWQDVYEAEWEIIPCD